MASSHQSKIYGILYGRIMVLSDFKSCRRLSLLYTPLTCMASWHFSDGSEDPDTTPVLEITDQKGNSIQLSLKEKKVTESQLFCVLCDQIHLAILLLTRNVPQIPFANSLNCAVFCPGSVTLASYLI